MTSTPLSIRVRQTFSVSLVPQKRNNLLSLCAMETYFWSFSNSSVEMFPFPLHVKYSDQLALINGYKSDERPLPKFGIRPSRKAIQLGNDASKTGLFPDISNRIGPSIH